MPFTMPGRSTLSTTSNDQTTAKSIKRRSFLPSLSRHDDGEERRISSGRESRSTNGTHDEEQGDDASSTGEKRSTVASTASRLRRPLSMMLNGEPKSRPQSIVRPSTRDTDAGQSMVGVTDKSSMEVSTAKRALSRSGDGIQRSMSTKSIGHTRTASTLSTTTRITSQRATFVPTSPSKLDRPISRREPKSTSTHQLQQSPTKHKTVAPASIPGSPQTDVISPEVARAQVELLQLSLKHESALAAVRSSDEHARAALRESHQRLRRSLGQVLGGELERERQVNLIAMSLWQSSQSYLMDRLRLLQRVHEDAKALLQDGSGFFRTVSAFRAWANDAESITSGEKAGFVAPLPDSWHQGHASSTLRVQSLQLELGSLPSAPRPSSIDTIMSACQKLLDGMLEELEVVAKIEKEVMRQDRARVDEAINALPQVSADKISDWTPRWQRVS